MNTLVNNGVPVFVFVTVDKYGNDNDAYSDTRYYNADRHSNDHV